MNTKTYDPACHDLAEAFMLDAPDMSPEAQAKLTCDLALTIQETIENWFGDQNILGWPR